MQRRTGGRRARLPVGTIGWTSLHLVLRSSDAAHVRQRRKACASGSDPENADPEEELAVHCLAPRRCSRVLPEGTKVLVNVQTRRFRSPGPGRTLGRRRFRPPGVPGDAARPSGGAAAPPRLVRHGVPRGSGRANHASAATPRDPRGRSRQPASHRRRAGRGRDVRAEQEHGESQRHPAEAPAPPTPAAGGLGGHLRAACGVLLAKHHRLGSKRSYLPNIRNGLVPRYRETLRFGR